MNDKEGKTVIIDPAVEHLSSLFKGGRIGGWVERNRDLIEKENPEGLELDLLLEHSPGFAELTEELSVEERIQKIREALIKADNNPLSATNYMPSPDNPNILVRK